MTEITAKFNEIRARDPKASIELEVRLGKIDQSQFSKYFEKFAALSTPEIHLQVDAVEMAPNMPFLKLIRHQEFGHDKGKLIKTLDEYREKKGLVKPSRGSGPDRDGPAVHISLEQPGKEFNMTARAFIRVKMRAGFTFAIEPEKPWRLDLSAVVEGPADKIGPQLQSLKEAAFGSPVTPGNFLAQAKSGIFTTFEAEIECLYKSGQELAPGDIVKAQNFVELDGNRPESGEIMPKIAEMLGNSGNTHITFKTLLPQVIQLTKKKYQEIWPLDDKYYIGDKADGMRCVIYADGPKCVIIGGNIYEEKSGPTTPTTLCDAEFVNDTYYIFDVMWLDGKNITKEGFGARNSATTPAAALLSKFGIRALPKLFTRCPKDAGPGLEKLIRATLEPAKKGGPTYEIDGLIIVNGESNYRETQSFKWKPTSHLSIDFLAKRMPKNMMGHAPYVSRPGMDLYLLFVTISPQDRQKFGLELISPYETIFGDPRRGPNIRTMPIQFMATSNPYAYIFYYDGDEDIDGKIVELRYAGLIPSSKLGSGRAINESPLIWEVIDWKFMRTRPDRSTEKGYFGNYYTIAIDIFTNYINPFPEKELWAPNFGYFETPETGDAYWPAKTYNRLVINNIFGQYLKGANMIADLAAGRGADIFRYEKLGINSALFVDVDSDAIAELITRQLSKNREGMTIFAAVADLKQPFNDTIDKVKKLGLNPGSFDAVVCNFAIHYFCDNSNHILNFISLVDSLLKPGGTFIYTTFSGKRVFEALKDKDALELRSPDAPPGAPPKFIIQKKYQGTKFTGLGQKIAVKLPFTTTPIDEPLADIAYINKLFKLQGFSVTETNSFTSMMPKIKQESSNVTSKMGFEDIEFVSLYDYVVLAKR